VGAFYGFFFKPKFIYIYMYQQLTAMHSTDKVQRIGVYIMGMRIKRTKRTKAVGSAQAGHAESNLMAACLIAADPVAYPEGSLPAQWSTMILERATVLQYANEMPLFAGGQAG
jgi:hypothetical protein